MIAREEVERLQELRGTYGIKAPAPICPDPATPADSGSGPGDVATCQVVEAPAGSGQRLVPDSALSQHPGSRPPRDSEDGEIRLTYRELSALIEEAIRSLR